MSGLRNSAQVEEGGRQLGTRDARHLLDFENGLDVGRHTFPLPPQDAGLVVGRIEKRAHSLKAEAVLVSVILDRGSVLIVAHDAYGCVKLNIGQEEALIFTPTNIACGSDKSCVMSNTPAANEPPRRHYIVEWAELRDKSQADIVRALDADKGTVSRWFSSGIIPTEKYLQPLATFLQLDEVVDLFRHPDDDWLAKMFRDKTEEQKEAAIDMLKIFFKNMPSDKERKVR
jgi:transcriptional regulator with XRE-family HTH domain